MFIEKFTAHQQELTPNEQLELAPLLEYCHRQRNLARTKMLAYLESKSYKKFKAGAMLFITKETPENESVVSTTKQPVRYQIRHVASTLIYARYEALRVYEPFLDNASMELLHQLRIDSKHFRYVLENLQEILGIESKNVLAEVKYIQNHLGDLNDANVACHFLDDFLNHWKNYRQKLTTESTKKPEAIIHYLEIKKAERENLLDTFSDVWHQFNSTQLRQHLALAISAL